MMPSISDLQLSTALSSNVLGRCRCVKASTAGEWASPCCRLLRNNPGHLTAATPPFLAESRPRRQTPLPSLPCPALCSPPHLPLCMALCSISPPSGWGGPRPRPSPSSASSERALEYRWPSRQYKMALLSPCSGAAQHGTAARASQSRRRRPQRCCPPAGAAPAGWGPASRIKSLASPAEAAGPAGAAACHATPAHRNGEPSAPARTFLAPRPSASKPVASPGSAPSPQSTAASNPRCPAAAAGAPALLGDPPPPAAPLANALLGDPPHTGVTAVEPPTLAASPKAAEAASSEGAWLRGVRAASWWAAKEEAGEMDVGEPGPVLGGRELVPPGSCRERRRLRQGHAGVEDGWAGGVGSGLVAMSSAEACRGWLHCIEDNARRLRIRAKLAVHTHTAPVLPRSPATAAAPPAVRAPVLCALRLQRGQRARQRQRGGKGPGRAQAGRHLPVPLLLLQQGAERLDEPQPPLRRLRALERDILCCDSIGCQYLALARPSSSATVGAR